MHHPLRPMQRNKQVDNTLYPRDIHRWLPSPSYIQWTCPYMEHFHMNADGGVSTDHAINRESPPTSPAPGPSRSASSTSPALCHPYRCLHKLSCLVSTLPIAQAWCSMMMTRGVNCRTLIQDRSQQPLGQAKLCYPSPCLYSSFLCS